MKYINCAIKNIKSLLCLLCVLYTSNARCYYAVSDEQKYIYSPYLKIIGGTSFSLSFSDKFDAIDTEEIEQNYSSSFMQIKGALNDDYDGKYLSLDKDYNVLSQESNNIIGQIIPDNNVLKHEGRSTISDLNAVSFNLFTLSGKDYQDFIFGTDGSIYNHDRNKIYDGQRREMNFYVNDFGGTSNDMLFHKEIWSNEVYFYRDGVKQSFLSTDQRGVSTQKLKDLKSYKRFNSSDEDSNGLLNVDYYIEKEGVFNGYRVNSNDLVLGSQLTVLGPYGSSELVYKKDQGNVEFFRLKDGSNYFMSNEDNKITLRTKAESSYLPEQVTAFKENGKIDYIESREERITKKIDYSNAALEYQFKNQPEDLNFNYLDINFWSMPSFLVFDNISQNIAFEQILNNTSSIKSINYNNTEMLFSEDGQEMSVDGRLFKAQSGDIFSKSIMNSSSLYYNGLGFYEHVYLSNFNRDSNSAFYENKYLYSKYKRNANDNEKSYNYYYDSVGNKNLTWRDDYDIHNIKAGDFILYEQNGRIGEFFATQDTSIEKISRANSLEEEGLISRNVEIVSFNNGRTDKTEIFFNGDMMRFVEYDADNKEYKIITKNYCREGSECNNFSTERSCMIIDQDYISEKLGEEAASFQHSSRSGAWALGNLDNSILDSEHLKVISWEKGDYSDSLREFIRFDNTSAVPNILFYSLHLQPNTPAFFDMDLVDSGMKNWPVTEMVFRSAHMGSLDIYDVSLDINKGISFVSDFALRSKDVVLSDNADAGVPKLLTASNKPDGYDGWYSLNRNNVEYKLNKMMVSEHQSFMSIGNSEYNLNNIGLPIRSEYFEADEFFFANGGQDVIDNGIANEVPRLNFWESSHEDIFDIKYKTGDSWSINEVHGIFDQIYDIDYQFTDNISDSLQSYSLLDKSANDILLAFSYDESYIDDIMKYNEVSIDDFLSSSGGSDLTRRAEDIMAMNSISIIEDNSNDIEKNYIFNSSFYGLGGISFGMDFLGINGIYSNVSIVNHYMASQGQFNANIDLCSHLGYVFSLKKSAQFISVYALYGYSFMMSQNTLQASLLSIGYQSDNFLKFHGLKVGIGLEYIFNKFSISLESFYLNYFNNYADNVSIYQSSYLNDYLDIEYKLISFVGAHVGFKVRF